MASARLNAVFTTNFDGLVEQAAGALFELTDIEPRPTLTVATLGEPEKAVRALQRSSFPLVVKLHGDFHSVRLKNTRAELRAELVALDEKMRSALSSACGRFGLVVTGYSGRDRSVMEVLMAAAHEPDSYPSGLYWCYRPGELLGPAVLELLSIVQGNDRTALSIEVDNFVELAGAVERAARFPEPVRRQLVERRPPPLVVDASLPTGVTLKYPLLRLNALPLVELPDQARLLHEHKRCELSEAQQALRSARARGLLARRSGGHLIAFGDDTQLGEALAPLGVAVTSTTDQLDWDSEVDAAQIGLALDAITIGLGRTTGLRHVLSRRAHQVRVVDAQVEALARLRAACGGELCGSVPNTALQWAEAATLTLDHRSGRWWLLVEPEIWVSPPERGTVVRSASWRREEKAAVAAFVQRKLATRYNRAANSILDQWAKLLCAGRDLRRVRTWNLEPGAGIDPSFGVDGHTAHSRPLATYASPGPPR